MLKPILKSEKGVVLQLLMVILLLLGIAAGYFLLKNPQVFKSRADNPAIVAKDKNGNPLEVVNNVAKTTDTKIKLELTSPLGSAAPAVVPTTAPVVVPTSVPQAPDEIYQEESPGNEF